MQPQQRNKRMWKRKARNRGRKRKRKRKRRKSGKSRRVRTKGRGSWRWRWGARERIEIRVINRNCNSWSKTSSRRRSRALLWHAAASCLILSLFPEFIAISLSVGLLLDGSCTSGSTCPLRAGSSLASLQSLSSFRSASVYSSSPSGVFETRLNYRPCYRLHITAFLIRRRHRGCKTTRARTRIRGSKLG